MNDNCIGVFDSGLGGLTCAKELMKILPREPIVYFGDTNRVPYGSKSDETIINYVKSDIKFLQTHNPKVIVIACGTATAIGLPAVSGSTKTPIFGVIDAAVDAAVKATKNKKIGIIATPASVRSGVYEEKIKKADKNIETIAVGCPLFAPLVEAGKANSDEALKAAEEYLASIKAYGVDTLILGCTHYPLLKDVICKVMGRDVTLIDPGKETAAFVKKFLEENDMLASSGTHKFYVSGEPDSFKKLAGAFLKREIDDEVQKINIEEYM